MNSKTYFYTDKPLFGLDIGHGSIKVMQLDPSMKKPGVMGFGHIAFEPSAVKDGVIVKPEVLATAAKDMFARHLVGNITTNRVAVAVPVARSFTRSISVPRLNKKELREAVQLEVEEYIPMPVEELYLDYSVVNQTAENIELFVIAVPKKIVDSYLVFTRMLGLETVLVQTTLDGVARFIRQDAQSDVPTVLIDFGSLSADISVFDKSLIVSGIAPGGGDVFTNLIAQRLGVNHQEAHLVKTKYGINASKKQQEILAAVEPTLAQVVKEIRRIIRYYEERYGAERKISQIVTVGGGTNMPGLTEYLTNQLRVAARACEPWQYLEPNRLQPPSQTERLLYTTAAGLALVNPKQVFAT
ncbi:MAG TPA: type IV pilus assembly protein PilM [Candidatus Saccharimonadales bacterium]|nr:type IV pilus assembly protein PilM [Candidatus Saccharimonadales bacterium]